MQANLRGLLAVSRPLWTCPAGPIYNSRQTVLILARPVLAPWRCKMSRCRALRKQTPLIQNGIAEVLKTRIWTIVFSGQK